MTRDTARLVGLDIARCLALLGMVATHVLEGRTPEGDLTTTQWLAGGRASALFAVLAGVSLALMTREPLKGARQFWRSAGIIGRAVIIAVIGLMLGGLETGIAVILTYYGVIFVLALPFTRLQARELVLLAVVWVVAAPVASHLIRPHLPPRGVESPTFEQLAHPGQLASELLFTGYYPAIPWLAYLIVGIGLGRLNLRDKSLLGGLAVGGLGLAVLATQISRAVVPTAVAEENAGGMFGNTPPDGNWNWLLLVAPHSSTPFDLAQTIGSAVAVIGLCLLLAQVLPTMATSALAVVFGAGTATLTLYTLHVWMRTPQVWPEDDLNTYLKHIGVLLVIGAVIKLTGLRGPLEALAALPSRLGRWAGRNPAAS